MAKVPSLALLAGTPIPFPEMEIEFVQPRIKDIAKMGEDNFYIVLNVFNTTKESIIDQMNKKYAQDKEALDFILGDLQFKTRFQIVREILDRDDDTKSHLASFLYICFPALSKVFIDKDAMIMTIKKEEGNKMVVVSDELYDELASMVNSIFGSDDLNKSSFNPANDKAAEIAAKIQKRRNIVAKEQGLDNKKTSSLATAVSILSTTDKIPLMEVLNYTLPQLAYQVERSKQFVGYNTQITLGAFSGLKDVEIADWSKAI